MGSFFIYIYSMEIQITLFDKAYKANLSQPFSIAIPMKNGSENPNAWYCDSPSFEPVVMGDFVGSVAKGSSVNFRNILFNPHGNGTHTESVNHISDLPIAVNHCFSCYFFSAQLISVTPQTINNDAVIVKEDVVAALQKPMAEAIVLRTLPNNLDKKTAHYSNQNPPYIEAALLAHLAEQGVLHFITDLPSVDREKDEGKLAAHKAFWQYPDNVRTNATITELAFIDSAIEDGLYLIEMQVAAFENDAAPSRPVLYRIEEVK